MRLWHKDLIWILPRQQLLGQWRECCLIAKNIKEKGTPNHLLVNKIMDYDISHFWCYTVLVVNEMTRRDYKVDFSKFTNHIQHKLIVGVPFNDLFDGWHNDRYCHQCLLNLQEKYDCGGIPEDEYKKIVKNTIVEDL